MCSYSEWKTPIYLVFPGLAEKLERPFWKTVTNWAFVMERMLHIAKLSRFKTFSSCSLPWLAEYRAGERQPGDAAYPREGGALTPWPAPVLLQQRVSFLSVGRRSSVTVNRLALVVIRAYLLSDFLHREPSPFLHLREFICSLQVLSGFILLCLLSLDMQQMSETHAQLWVAEDSYHPDFLNS